MLRRLTSPVDEKRYGRLRFDPCRGRVRLDVVVMVRDGLW